ncbi:hypothetical protein J6590_105166 [Homalodisca vitripennis]|nr:hypothetical protein J6590_105166 [Homalodisca vitripennis]
MPTRLRAVPTGVPDGILEQQFRCTLTLGMNHRPTRLPGPVPTGVPEGMNHRPTRLPGPYLQVYLKADSPQGRTYRCVPKGILERWLRCTLTLGMNHMRLASPGPYLQVYLTGILERRFRCTTIGMNHRPTRLPGRTYGVPEGILER